MFQQSSDLNSTNHMKSAKQGTLAKKMIFTAEHSHYMDDTLGYYEKHTYYIYTYIYTHVCANTSGNYVRVSFSNWT